MNLKLIAQVIVGMAVLAQYGDTPTPAAEHELIYVHHLDQPVDNPDHRALLESCGWVESTEDDTIWERPV